MKRLIYQALRTRPKPLVQNTNDLIGKMSKTKGDLKGGTPSKHLNAIGERILEQDPQPAGDTRLGGPDGHVPGCIWTEEFMAEDLCEEDIVGLVFGFELVATDGAVG
jgi:hypothetical protein